MNDLGLTKQLCNRLLEPFMWTTMLITGSKEGWDNFFKLRCPSYEVVENKVFKSRKDAFKGMGDYDYHCPKTDLQWLSINKGQAEIHMMALAECIWDARNESTPKQLSYGQWHIPFEDKIDLQTLHNMNFIEDVNQTVEGNILKLKVKISTAMAARTSYTVVGNEKEFSIKNHIDLHNKLISSVPIHGSPMEHCAKVPTDKEYYYNIKGEGFDTHDDALGFHPESYGWFDNFHGYIPYRKLLENETSI